MTVGSPGNAATAPPGDDIVFVSNWAENFGASELYSIDVASGQRTRLTSTPFDSERAPKVSPDGTRIAFFGARNDASGRIGVFVADGDGRNARLISAGINLFVAVTTSLAWSPDGASVAFVGDISPGHLYIVNVRDGAPKQIAEAAYDAGIAWSPHGDRVAFDGGQSLAVVDPNGEELRSLGVRGRDPAWSPDGSAIAFVVDCCEEGGHGLFVVDADGDGAPRRIVGGDARMPAWAPDGEALAFVRGSLKDRRVFVVRRDGGGQRILSHDTSLSPVWLPDGRSIAYVVSRAERIELDTGNPATDELHIIQADGSGDRALPSIRLEELGQPASTPDGHSLVFAAALAANDPELFVMRADGTQVHQVTNNLATDRDPSWSPDHRKIAFVRDAWSDENPYADCTFCPLPWIYVMNADGTGSHRLIRGKHPVWSNDGRKVAFDDGYDIFVIPARGGRPRRVSHNRDWRSLNPSWSPDDRRIVFERALRITIAPSMGGQARYRTPARKGDELGLDSLPSWSPNGSSIAFDRRDRVCIFSLATTRVRCLGPPEESWSPKWSPNGERLIFDSYERRRKHRVIVIAGVRGGERMLRSDAPGDAIQPDW
jgi:Tol biopolymer transport system component